MTLNYLCETAMIYYLFGVHAPRDCGMTIGYGAANALQAHHDCLTQTISFGNQEAGPREILNTRISARRKSEQMVSHGLANVGLAVPPGESCGCCAVAGRICLPKLGLSYPVCSYLSNLMGRAICSKMPGCIPGEQLLSAWKQRMRAFLFYSCPQGLSASRKYRFGAGERTVCLKSLI